MQAARDDYRHVSKDRQMLVTLPKAWTQLIEDEDEMLLEIVADRVESLCGFKPDPDMVAQFLKSSIATRSAPPHQPSRSTIQHLPAPRPVVLPQPIVPPSVRSVSPTAPIRLGFTFKGKFRACKNAIDVLRDVFETLIQNDPSFPERFAGLPKHGNKRRYLARDVNELYPGRPDLCRENAVQLTSGWWLGTNHSRQMIARIIDGVRRCGLEVCNGPRRHSWVMEAGPFTSYCPSSTSLTCPSAYATTACRRQSKLGHAWHGGFSMSRR